MCSLSMMSDCVENLVLNLFIRIPINETTKADKRIIENNQKGVLSSKYEPGPLSKMEIGLDKLKKWYLKHLELEITK